MAGDTGSKLPGTVTNAILKTASSLILPETQLSFTDVTTNDVSTSKHGFVPKSPNDATKYLDGTGAYSVPAGGASELILISRQTATGVASLDFTSISSGSYDHYMIYISHLLSATQGNIVLRYSTAATFRSDAGYTDQEVRFTFNSLGESGSASTETSMILNSSSEPTKTTAGTHEFDAIVHIGNCAQTTAKKKAQWQSTYFSSNSVTISIAGGGWYNTSTAAVDGFRILSDAGNLTSGTVALYGIKNS